jgi:Mrp family chromosome partitioning ATPase
MRALYLDVDPQSPRPVTAGGAEHRYPPDGETERSGLAANAIRPVNGVEGLDILESARLLDSQGTKALIDLRLLLEQLRGSYDLIVIDTAPVLILEDANWLSPFVDAILLVARFGRTTERELVGAVSRLNINRAPLIGSVLNCVDPRGRSVEEPLGAVSYPRKAKAYFQS